MDRIRDDQDENINEVVGDEIEPVVSTGGEGMNEEGRSHGGTQKSNRNGDLDRSNVGKNAKNNTGTVETRTVADDA